MLQSETVFICSMRLYSSCGSSHAQRTPAMSRTKLPPSMCPWFALGLPPLSPANESPLPHPERSVAIGTTPFAHHTSGARPGKVSSFLSSIQRSSTGGCHPEKFFGVGLFHAHTSFAETTSGRFSLRANHHSICISERPEPQSE